MSLVKQIKTAEARIEALQAEVQGAVEGRLAAEQTLESNTAAHVEAVAGFESRIAELTASTTAMEAVKAEQAAKLLEMEAAATEAAAQIEKLNRALANPAYAQAAAAGTNPVEGAAAEDDPDLPRTQEQWHDAYNRIEDPKERAAFRNKYRKELGLK